MATAIHGLPTPPLTGVSPDVPRDIKALADALDPKLTPFSAGLAADRPAPKIGMRYWAYDQGAMYVGVGGSGGSINWRDERELGGPPLGNAGGDLGGSYPNPLVKLLRNLSDAAGDIWDSGYIHVGHAYNGDNGWTGGYFAVNIRYDQPTNVWVNEPWAGNNGWALITMSGLDGAVRLMSGTGNGNNVRTYTWAQLGDITRMRATVVAGQGAAFFGDVSVNLQGIVLNNDDRLTPGRAWRGVGNNSGGNVGPNFGSYIAFGNYLSIGNYRPSRGLRVRVEAPLIPDNIPIMQLIVNGAEHNRMRVASEGMPSLEKLFGPGQLPASFTMGFNAYGESGGSIQMRNGGGLYFKIEANEF